MVFHRNGKSFLLRWDKFVWERSSDQMRHGEISMTKGKTISFPQRQTFGNTCVCWREAIQYVALSSSEVVRPWEAILPSTFYTESNFPLPSFVLFFSCRFMKFVWHESVDYECNQVVEFQIFCCFPVFLKRLIINSKCFRLLLLFINAPKGTKIFFDNFDEIFRCCWFSLCFSLGCSKIA